MAENKSYVTNELLDELNGILEEKTMFDDFSSELAKTAPVEIPIKPSDSDETVRERYLKERRKHGDRALPDSVDPETT
jgi:3-deoxy-D-manno-octulosonate 8-phosphate phosphatase KdsC-like HAD superfamily phosphatase